MAKAKILKTLKPNPQEEDQTYCILSLKMLKLSVPFLRLVFINTIFELVRVGVGSHYKELIFNQKQIEGLQSI